MADLKALPPPIRSADELMALAHALEAEAARRYRSLAARMRRRDEPALAELFDFLAGIEDKHASQVAERALETLGHPVAAARVARDLPENFDEEEGSSRRLTPYRALAAAVRNEERAFAFFSYVAAGAPDDATRALAESLAQDELAHAFLLRGERRKAYRKARPDRTAETSPLPASLAELWSLCLETESRAARYHFALAETLSGVAATSFRDVARDEERLAREAAAALAGAALPDHAVALPSIAGGLRLLEEAFERYADIAERSGEEAVLQLAQRLAEHVVARLSLVGGASANTLLE